MGRVRGWLKVIKSQAGHKALLASLIIPFLLLGANSLTAQPTPDCIGSRISLSALERNPPSPFSPLMDPKLPLDAGLYCLADHNERSRAQRIFQVSHTLWDLVQFEEQAQGEELPQGRDFHLKLSEGVEVLALHFDPRATLVKMLLDSQNLPYPQALLEAPDSQEELIIQFGGVASLAAKLDFMASLMQYLVHSLTASSEIPLPPSEDEVTLVFNLKGGKAALDIAAVLRGSTLLSDPDLAVQNQLDISQITVTIGNGTITGETQLDPADLTITRGQLEVKFQIGPNSITSTTVFAKGEGLKEEILVVTAKLGALNLTGQATFGSELQKFKLEASLAGLVFSTMLTPEGLSQPTFGFELHF